MFKKLLSNLPFNPSLIGQVSFYSKRVHSEERVRRLGFTFVAFALVLQLFAVLSPPEPTLAESPNDMVRGGFTSREQAINYCRDNTQDFANVLAYYKVTCETLGSAVTKNVASTDHNGQLDSLGRVAQGPRIERTGKVTDEYSAFINGTQYFMKNLWAWDSGSSSTYKVLEVKNTDGVTIMIMYSCGNIVTIDKYSPPPPPPPPKTPKPPTDVCLAIAGTQTKKEECDVCPNVPGEQSHKSECYPCPKAKEDKATTACLELSKTASNQTQNIIDANGTLALANDVIIYTISAKNTGSQTIKDFVFEENITDVLEYASAIDLNGGKIDDKKTVLWDRQDVAAGETIQKKITVKVQDPVPQTPASDPDPASFDLVMTNVFYGDSIIIKLPPGVTKSTEHIVQTLPNTGPGTTLVAGIALTVIVGYFFARSRLMAKELDFVRSDFASTGGY